MSKFSKKFISTSPFKQTGKKNKSNILSDIEYAADQLLNHPEEKARNRTDKELGIKADSKTGLMKDQNSFPMGDARRHYNAGDETSRAIQDKLKPLPYITRVALGTLGSNIGGLIHEAQNIKSGRPVKESIEDAANNLAGSIGSLFTRKTSKKLFDNFYKKIAPDGKVKD